MKKRYWLLIVFFLLNLAVIDYLFISKNLNKNQFKDLESTGAYFDVDLDDNQALDQAFGGTNAITDSAARIALGLEIGADIQGYDSDLDIYKEITPSSDVQSLLGAVNNAAILSQIGAEAADATILKEADVDDIPVNGITTVPISSNWAYDHTALFDPHTGYMLESNIGIGANNYIQLNASGELPAVSGANLTNLPAQTLTASTDPDLATTGEITQDTDGANVALDQIIRAADASGNQYPVGKKLITIQFTAISPNSWADANRDKFIIWSNDTGMIFNITRMFFGSDVDDTDITVNSYPGWSDWTASTIEAVAIDDNGTGVYYKAVTSGIDDTTVASGELIGIDFDDTDNPGIVKGTIEGWFDANVD